MRGAFRLMALAVLVLAVTAANAQMNTRRSVSSWVTWSEGTRGIVYQGGLVPHHIVWEDPQGVFEMVVDPWRAYYTTLRKDDNGDRWAILMGVDRTDDSIYALYVTEPGGLWGLAISPNGESISFINRGTLFTMDVRDLTAPGEAIARDGDSQHSAGSPSWRDENTVVYDWAKEPGGWFGGVYRNPRRILRLADVSDPDYTSIATLRDDPRADLCSPSMVGRQLVFHNETDGWVWMIQGGRKIKVVQGFYPSLDPLSRTIRIIYASNDGGELTVNEAVVQGRRVTTRVLSGPGIAMYPHLWVHY